MMNQKDWREPFNRRIWCLYRRRWLRWIVKVALWLILILGMYLVGKWANVQSWGDPVELFRAILKNKLGPTPTPYTPVWLLYKFIYLGIPALFIWLCWRPIIQFFTFSCSPYKQVKTLHDEESSWELTELGRKWINEKVTRTLYKWKGLRSEGCEIYPKKVTWICDILYHTTRAEKMSATCLKVIAEMYNNDDDRAYLEDTMRTIYNLGKTLSRFYITSNTFEELFSVNPSEAVKWFVRLHHANNCELYYVHMRNFTFSCDTCWVPDDRRDILFFDGSLSLLFKTDPITGKVVKIDGRNILYAMDTKDHVRNIAELFGKLHSLPTTKNVLEEIRKKNWEGAYNITL